jgi:hypothetical protein
MGPVPVVIPALRQNLRSDMTQQLMLRAGGTLLQQRRRMKASNKFNCSPFIFSEIFLKHPMKILKVLQSWEVGRLSDGHRGLCAL